MAVVDFPPELLEQKLNDTIYLDALQHIWQIYMPVLAIIGFLFIVAGFSMQKKKTTGSTGKIASMLNIIWAFAYMIHLDIVLYPIMIKSGEFPAIFLKVVFLSCGFFTCCYPFFYLLYRGKIDYSEPVKAPIE